MAVRSNYEDEEQNEDSTKETKESGTENRGFSNHICIVCQQPVAVETSKRWKDEPVHAGCGAELRCGVKIGPSFD